MMLSKRDLLMPLIHSNGGIHLTAYLSEIYTPAELKKNIRGILSEARRLMKATMTRKEMDYFLKPIMRLVDDVDFYKNVKANFALFLTKDYFQIVNVPIGIEKLCVVSSSFHIKPLLKWIQTDRDFVFIGLNETSASLYQGNLYAIQYIDSIMFPEAKKFLSENVDHGSIGNLKMKRIISLGTIEWLSDWVEALTLNSAATIFVAGESTAVELIKNDSQFKNIDFKIISDQFCEELSSEYYFKIRNFIHEEVKKEQKRNLFEMEIASQMRLVSNNIFKISKLATEGKVRKIVIADDINIFGILNKKNGSLVIHSEQVNVLDDDLLDDIAQEVLVQGGEVVLMPRKKIPNEEAILAILSGDQVNLNQPIVRFGGEAKFKDRQFS